MKTYDLSKSTDDSGFVICPHCAAKNSRKAYCCLSCFKVMYPDQKLGFLRANVPPSISITIVLAALVIAGLYLANRWLASIEANMSLHIKTNDYSVAMSAEKKKNEKLNKEISVEKNPSE